MNFDKYDDEPEIKHIVFKCNAYRFLKDDGEELDNNYLGKATTLFLVLILQIKHMLLL
jgi:hypothetical protein